ncbi:MAG: acetyltransferase [Bryobacteraceae bacterium]|nr:acetyltransferase [Bryobacteraceae bacterium]
MRALTEQNEFRDAVQLQKTIWGFEDIDLLPVRLFVVSTKIGGQVFGAFDRTKMVAFLLAIPGVKPGGKSYIHSHMLGVLKDYRNFGLGRRLKLAQREEAIARGFDLIEWTFDPLELKNAFFNVERLGAVVRRFVYNQYGTTSSHLHGGLPTDRCIAEWHINGERARTVTAGGTYSRPSVEARISIPADIAEIKMRDPEKARAIQAAAGADFTRYFREGLAVIGVESNSETGTYLLGPWESN